MLDEFAQPFGVNPPNIGDPPDSVFMYAVGRVCERELAGIALRGAQEFEDRIGGALEDGRRTAGRRHQTHNAGGYD